MKPAEKVTMMFLGLLAALHVARLLFQVEVVAGDVTIPMWASVFAVLGPSALATWLWREQRGWGAAAAR